MAGAVFHASGRHKNHPTQPDVGQAPPSQALACPLLEPF